jgi:zinc transport system substrate-binding protein
VRGHHQRRVRGARLEDEQFRDRPLERGIEVARRFIGKHEHRLRDERPRDRHALPLAMREPIDRALHLVAKPDAREQLAGAGTGRIVEQKRPVQPEGEQHILEDIERRHEFEGLEHLSDARRAIGAAFGLAHGRQRAPLRADLAVSWQQFAGKEREQGALPGAGRPAHRERRACRKRKSRYPQLEARGFPGGAPEDEPGRLDEHRGRRNLHLGLHVESVAEPGYPAGMGRLALILVVVAALVSQMVGCGGQSQPPATRAPGAKPRVFAAHPALSSMVRELAGGEVELVEPWTGEPDPAYWRPRAEQIRDIQSCDLIILNGAGYEPWAAQAALPRARTIDTTSAAKDKLIEVEGETHSHGPEGEHTHSTTASTTWLSPTIARAQAGAIADALRPFFATPEAAAALAARKTALDATFTRTEKALAELRSLEPKWLASHPVYQYLGQASGIEIESKHWEPGEMPSDREWTKFRLTRAAFPKPIAWMLWEDEPGPEIRAQLAKDGVEVLVVPLFPTSGGEFAISYALLVEKAVEKAVEERTRR